MGFSLVRDPPTHSLSHDYCGQVSVAEIVYHFLKQIFSLDCSQQDRQQTRQEREEEAEPQLTYHPFLESGLDYESPETDSFSYQPGKLDWIFLIFIITHLTGTLPSASHKEMWRVNH